MQCICDTLDRIATNKSRCDLVANQAPWLYRVGLNCWCNGNDFDLAIGEIDINQNVVTDAIGCGAMLRKNNAGASPGADLA